MKFENLLQKLHSSKVYEDFEKKYKGSFVVAGFFVIDLESKQNLEQIDYYVPSENKIAAFTIGSPINMQMLEIMKSDTKPVPINVQTSIDIDALEGIIDDEMKNRGISEKIKKIVAILHITEGKPIWNLSCILSGMGILKAHVEDSSKTVLKMEKSNLFEIMKKVPASQFKQMQQGQGKAGVAAMGVQMPSAEQIQQAQQMQIATPEAVQKPMTQKEMTQAVSTEIKKLDMIEKQIEKEKVLLKEELEKEKKAAKIAEAVNKSSKSKKAKKK